MDVEKLVVNLSSHPLTEPQLSVLSKGLNFCPTPGEPDLGVTKEDMDRFHRDLRRKAFGLSKRPLPNNEEIIDDSDTESIVRFSLVRCLRLNIINLNKNPPGIRLDLECWKTLRFK